MKNLQENEREIIGQQEEKKNSATAVHQNRKPMVILLADDNPAIRDTLSDGLKAYGYRL